MGWRRKKSEAPDDLTLDEAFIAAATLLEPSAEERVAQGRRRRVEETSRMAVRSLRRTRRVRRWRRVPVAIVTVVVLAALVWLGLQSRPPPEGSADRVIDLSHGEDRRTYEATVTDRPSPGREQAPAPLGAPAPVTEVSDRHAFMAMQPAAAEPVAYDPCRPIHVVVNERTAPPGADTLLLEALAAVHAATGLVFTVDGTTTEAPAENRAPYQPDRYPDRWAPVLVAWSDPVESPVLTGDVGGTGGSVWVSSGDDQVYVTGSVVLDGPQLTELLDRRGGRTAARAIVLHELAHVVGLDHVDDPEQLMTPTATRRATFGAGDLTGLARLGRGKCVPGV